MAESWDGYSDDKIQRDEAIFTDSGEASMETEGDEDLEMKHSSSLQLMLSSIAEERGKDYPGHKLVSDGNE